MRLVNWSVSCRAKPVICWYSRLQESPQKPASEDLGRKGWILGHKLPKEKTRDADHREAARVNFDVVQPHKVRALAPAQAQGVETQVAGATVFLVLHAGKVAVILVALQVVLRESLVAQADDEHRGLHLVQAKRAVQLVLRPHESELVKEGAPVRGLGEDGDECCHGETTVLHLGLPVVVVHCFRRGRGAAVEDPGRDGHVERVKAQVRRAEPGVVEVLVGRGLGRWRGRAATEEAARSARGFAPAPACGERATCEHGAGRRREGSGASWRR
mmetsp:Transcript_52658/g.162877  ORF Transcript_52658/g.162877 Transcript_52658/m.162877 type:complete len:272 (+) Transcript_52658:187-1002(+)